MKTEDLTPALYENAEIPEGINYSRVHPLREFALLTTGVIGTIVLIVGALAYSAEYVARYIPFGVELALVDRYADWFAGADAAPSDAARVAYLRGLGERLAAAEDLPAGMEITVHYVDDGAVNAFATLGGHVFVYRGLLEELHSENALAMVIAHEIAHVKHRDPITALGRGLTVSLGLASLAGLTDSSLFDNVLGRAGALTTLTFSRHQETRADAQALRALTRVYGHVGGAGDLFVALRARGPAEPPAFLNTHPLTSDRLERIRNHGGGHAGPLIPLPDVLHE